MAGSSGEGPTLTPKQQAFVNEYLIDLNATQAAIRAGYSEKTAYSIGQENLNKPEIQESIQAAMDKRAKRTEVTADRVIRELAKLAFSNVQDFVDGDGKLLKPGDISRDDAAAIQEITESVVGGDDESVVVNRKYKLSDKKASLELLGKHLKLFTDKVEHSGNYTFSMNYEGN